MIQIYDQVFGTSDVFDTKFCSCEAIDGSEKVVLCGTSCVAGTLDEDPIKF